MGTWKRQTVDCMGKDHAEKPIHFNAEWIGFLICLVAGWISGQLDAAVRNP
ncbi:hypothetical protein [Clostridium sp. 1001283B150225_161107_B6]|uniref:hypothetical protein n=1 Tax=Clostridium sp. 1001283B150225_161107_B6 TaxID=2787141 RepID=UPI001A9BB10B|nr:hypothetical protein [Clostridium sp. 1001283B150225_161107_B6]